jgi:hypothetical protein
MTKTVAFLMLGFTSAFASPVSEPVRRSFDLPVHISLDAQSSPCAGSPPPRLAVEGRLLLGGLRASLDRAGDAIEASLRSGAAGVALLPIGQPLGITRRPAIPVFSAAEPMRDPYLWLQLFDERGRALTGEIFLGRFAQGRFQAEDKFSLPAAARADVVPAACADARGSQECVAVRGAMTVSGITGRFMLRDRDTAQTVAMTVTLLPRAQVLPFASRPVRAASGRDAALVLELRRGDGGEIGPP